MIGKPANAQPVQKSLSDILDEMDSLDVQYTPEEREEVAGNYVTHAEDHYSEYINPGFAKALLGNDFDDTCMYQLVTQLDCTVVVKINPNIDPNSEPVLDDHGNVISAHIMEYPLAEETEHLGYPTDEPSVRLELMQDKEDSSKKNLSGVLMACLFAALLFIWLGIILFLVKVGGL